MESLEALRTPHGRYGLTTDTGCWSRLSMLPNCWICFVRQSRLSARGACAIGHVAGVHDTPAEAGSRAFAEEPGRESGNALTEAKLQKR
jgi:hypothetical protein